MRKFYERKKICWHIIIFDIYFMFHVLTYYIHMKRRHIITQNTLHPAYVASFSLKIIIFKKKKSEIETESIRILQQQQLYELNKHKQYKVHSI